MLVRSIKYSLIVKLITQMITKQLEKEINMVLMSRKLELLGDGSIQTSLRFYFREPIG